MAANAVIEWYSKNLVITGTEQADTVFVNSYVNAAGVKYISVTYNGAAPTQYFKLSDVNSIVRFDGLGGNDYFNNNVMTLKTSANGGAGDDTLIGDALQDTLRGGISNDYIAGINAYDELSGDGATTAFTGARARTGCMVETATTT